MADNHADLDEEGPEPRRVAASVEAVKTGRARKINRLLADMHPADVADLLE